MVVSVACVTSSDRLKSLRPMRCKDTSPLFSPSTTSALDACSAGSSPNSGAMRKATAPVNSKACQSSGASNEAGTNAGRSADSRRIAPQAMPSPASAPAEDSMRLSSSSCRTSCRRVAPIASRTASSRLREAERASSRLATFAHAISKHESDDDGKQAAGAHPRVALRRAHPRPPERTRDKAQALVVLRKELREPGCLRLEHRLDLPRPCCRRRARHDVEHANRPIPKIKAVDPGENRCVRRRYPDVNGADDIETMERRRGDTDNRERPGVELNDLIQNVRSTSEPPVPQRVANHDVGMLVGDFVFAGRVREGAAESGPHSKKLEVVPRHDLSRDLLCLTSPGGHPDGDRRIRERLDWQRIAQILIVSERRLVPTGVRRARAVYSDQRAGV